MREGELLVLRYHRVIPDDEPEPVYRLGVHRHSFAGQIRHLARRARLVDLDGARAFLAAQDHGPGRRVLVTLDDGYRDNHSEAAPVLRGARVPAVVFVTTGHVGGARFLWERLKNVVETPGRRELPLPGGEAIRLTASNRTRRDAFRRLHRWLQSLPARDAEALLRLWEASGGGSPRNDGPLSWEEVRDLHRDGIWIGSHTVSHPRLSSLDAETLRREVTASRQRLEEELGGAIRSFAYPSGDLDEHVVMEVKRAGYDIAFTTRPGTNAPGADPLRVHRKGIAGPSSETPWGRFSPSLFQAELSGLYDALLRRAPAIEGGALRSVRTRG
jgi:peptidoglycan/xylan/chitin deacetylase (PgdA/CDA1 family)